MRDLAPLPAVGSALAPDHAALAAWRAELAVAARSPWLASLIMTRLDRLRTRLDHFRRWLADLSRCQRRAWARRLALASPAAILALALSASPPAHAANITVDAGVVVIANDGDCSLREAIINANDNAATHADCTGGDPGPDTITLPAASTFTVPDVDNTTDGENGLPSITSEITIDGNGSIIERDTGAADTFRLFHVAAGGDLTLDATTVRYGIADDDPDDYGGGILSFGYLDIRNGSVISGNYATEDGGGIAAFESSVTITGSTVGGNSAVEAGGGIFGEFVDMEITGSTISGNTAVFLGGGVTAYAGSVSIVDSMVSSNTAGFGGGVVAVGASYPYTNSLTIAGSTIAGNTAYAFLGGGGVLVAFSDAEITQSTISGNFAPIGGGVTALQYGGVDIDHSAITGNTAIYGGGVAALYFIAPGPGATTITNSTISGNTAYSDGGGILTVLPASGSSLVLRNSTITANVAPYGGGIASFDGTTTLTNTIIANHAYGGDCDGAVFASLDFNLDSDGTCNLTGPNDIPNGFANLGPLALNPPGTTATHALLPGSDAINAGDCSGGAVTDDQRGVPRPQGPACDIGAFELEAAPTGATLTAFTARRDPLGRVVLDWETVAEADVAGFNVERAADPAGPWARVNDALIPAGGSAAGGGRYRFVDDARRASDPPHYRLEVIDSNGPPQVIGPIEAVWKLFQVVLPSVLR